MSKKILDSDGLTELTKDIASKIADKYATKDSIPTTLPANGGDAYTLNGLHASEIISNPNLLINPDFKINQYGFSSKTFDSNVTYFIDRWTGERCVITKNSSGGIDFSWNGTDGSDGRIVQRLENSQYLYGKNVTLSADIDGVRKKISFTLPSEINKTTYWIDFTNSSIGAWLGINNQSHVYVVLVSKSTTATNINNVKLEVGSVATPFIPPDPVTELLKCQRYYYSIKGVSASEDYFQSFGSGICINTTKALINLPIIMRITPTIRSSGLVICTTYTNSSGDMTNTGYSSIASISACAYKHGIKFTINLNSGVNLIKGSYAMFTITAPEEGNGYFTLDAEIY